MKEISFEDRFAMLVDIEYSNRKKNSLMRLSVMLLLITGSLLEGINHTSGRSRCDAIPFRYGLLCLPDGKVP